MFGSFFLIANRWSIPLYAIIQKAFSSVEQPTAKGDEEGPQINPARPEQLEYG
jgi:hypothetical protein